MASPAITIILMLSALLLIDAKLSCNNIEEKGTICHPGDEDFILTKDFVSDLPYPPGITLRGCRVKDIHPGSFNNDSSYSLLRLDLSKNKLTSVNEDVFCELKYLVHLNLSYNIISELTEMIFSNLTNLETLDLRGNNIKQLEPGLFVNVQQLQYLDLSYNALIGDTLHPLILQENSHLQYLDLSGNNLNGLVSNFFSWARELEILYLNDCSLTEVPNLRMFKLNTLKHLSLSFNTIGRIEKVNTFNYLSNLETLNLAHNIIEYIVARVFILGDQLKTIILKHNRLKVIPEEMFQDLPNLTILDLSYNLIEELEFETFEYTQLSNLNLAGNRIAFLPPLFCANLRDIQVILKQFYFHRNPWRCSCLKEILTEVKKIRIEYNSDRFNGNVPVCVIGSQRKCNREKQEDKNDSDDSDDDDDDDDNDDDNKDDTNDDDKDDEDDKNDEDNQDDEDDEDEEDDDDKK